MYLVLVALVWVIFGIVFVRWNSWKEYYPTILYYIMLNLLYDFLYYNHSLWEFKAITTDILNHTIISLFFYFLIIPVSIFIYLQRYPNTTYVGQAAYILVWSLFYFVIEYLFSLEGMFVYSNGWSVWDSGWFDMLMFVMLRIHHKKPLLALILTVIIIATFIGNYSIPISDFK